MPDCKADATRAQEQAVGRALRRSPHVMRVFFVSKAVGLKRFKKKNPLLVKQLPAIANSLPDEWVVTVDSDRNEAKVGQAICAAHYRGVEACHPAPEMGGVQWGSPITDRIRRLR